MRTQSETLQWAVDAFGIHALDRKVRARRLLEEAVELAQAEGVTLREVNRLAMYVYSRPTGDIAQEIAGVFITLQSMAESAGVNLTDAVESEWNRIDSKSVDSFRIKNEEKVRAGI